MRRGWGFFILLLSIGFFPCPSFATQYEEYPSIKLRSLDKITARTLTFDAQVGNTVKFGDIYIKIQSCRKPPPVEKKEAAAFLQIWQVDKLSKESHWVFSGWMFSSSPALSAMNHSVYDVWVIDCLGKDPEATPAPSLATDGKALPDEGTVPEESVIKPDIAPEEQKIEREPEPKIEKILNPQKNSEPEPEIEQNQVTPEENIEGIY
jgi:hypothetical protein